ncbi:MAG: TonB-dependent receptor, partial [Caulobacteraceae bacterium]
SQALTPRIASNVELITGALPAEYGLRTAGLVDVTTKSGVYQNGGDISIYGGSRDEIEPSFEFQGSAGKTNFFVTGSYLHDDIGIESPDRRADPLHDNTDQFNGFAYLETILNPQSRISMVLGASDNHFQIPDVSGELNGGLGLTVSGQSDDPSQQLNESQTENTQYAILSYLHTSDRFTGQASVFGRYSTLKFTPDLVGDILYDGLAQIAAKSEVAGGLQADGVYHLSDAHTLRAGVLVQIEHATGNTTSSVLLIDDNPADPTFGSELTDAPFTIVDSEVKTAETYSAYLQDEWKLRSNLTLNYGLRFDDFDGFRNEDQLSPRANLVWLPEPSTTIHLGYARYFSPPPLELIASQSVQKFVEPIPGNPNVTSSGSPVVAACGSLVGTTQCPLVTADGLPYSERSNYFDVGVSQKFGSALTAAIDSYYKTSTHLIDEGQFGAPIILTPFNYQRGRQYGVELTGSYAKGPITAYANFAWAVAKGEDWMTAQFDFSQAQLDYAANHFIFLDHDATYTASAGASYLWRGTRFGGDLLYGSGLRGDLPLATPVTEPDGSILTAIPNGSHTAGYVQVNLSISHRFEDVAGAPLEVRFDVINVFDEVYQIRNGSGVGVFAPQYGPRRGFFVGLTKDF